jgi:hypothetical protein
MLNSGTAIVGGVNPRKAGQRVDTMDGAADKAAELAHAAK